MTEHNPEGDRLFPYDSVVGVLDDERAVNETVHELTEAGFDDQEIFVLSGRGGVETIDPKGEHHGLLGKIFRKLDTLGDEHDETEVHVKALREGRYVVGAHVTDDGRKIRAREVFERHNGHHVSYYTRWTTERLVP